MKMLKHHMIYSLRIIYKNPIYSLVYVAIVGLGVFATLIFYTYIQSEYLHSRIPTPPHADEVYIVPLQDIEKSFWMYNAADLKLIEQNLGDQGIIAPVVSKKIAVKSDLSQNIVAGVSCTKALRELFTVSFYDGTMFSDRDWSEKKCILSFAANTIFFNGKKSVGETVWINGEEFEVIGITQKEQIDFLNIYNTDPAVLIPEQQFARIDQDLQQGMYYSVFFIKPNRDSLLIRQLYEYINENILTKRGLNKKLRTIMTVEEYVRKEFRDQWAEAMLLLFIVSLGILTSLVHQINLSILFQLNRMKKIAIELMVGGTLGGLFTQIFLTNSILSFLGIGFSIGIRLFVNSLMKIFHSTYVLDFPYHYLYIAAMIELGCIILVSLITLRHIKQKRPLQLIQI